MTVPLCIVGGRLQGLEAAYLAKKAGYQTILLDKQKNPPAAPLVDEFHRVDVLREMERAAQIIRRAEAVLPALEDLGALVKLEQLCTERGVPYMQDNLAFYMTEDKARSKIFLRQLGLPHPRPWPAAFPTIVKPARQSGSTGIHRVMQKGDLNQAIEHVLKIDPNYVIEEFVGGKSLSLELIGKAGEVRPLQITGLEFDETYGCKRVIAPCSLEHEQEVMAIGRRVGEGLRLTGITDLQLIAGSEGLKVIEMNARLPSQTPATVYNSTGINMVELLHLVYVEGVLPAVVLGEQKAVIYQHIKAEGDSLTTIGEHALADAQSLRLEEGLFGADEVLTNLPESGRADGCMATLIVKGDSLVEAKAKMEATVEEIMKKYKISKFTDSSPEGVFSFYDAIDT